MQSCIIGVAMSKKPQRTLLDVPPAHKKALQAIAKKAQIPLGLATKLILGHALDLHKKGEIKVEAQLTEDNG